MATKLSAAQRDVLVRTILGEARGEGVSGMEAVAHNIMNRAGSGRFPSDPAAVALQPYQYSTWNRGEGGNNPQQFRPGTRAYNEAADVIDRVFSGQTTDPTNGALYYHTPQVNPSWAGEVNQYGTTRLGNHIFYNGRPTPPADIPNAVASRLDITPPRATTGFPTPMPNELRAQRTLMQSLANPQPAADPYRGIYQPARLTAPGAVNQSVQGAQSGQNSQLAQSLQNYANRQTPRSSPPPMSYAGQDRAPPSNRRLTDAELARVPVNQGTFVPTQTRLPSIRQAPVAQMTRSEQRSEQRADNGQVRPPARPVTQPSRPVGTQAPSPIQEQRAEQLAMRNRQPARPVVPPTAAQLQAGTGFRVPNLATQPATTPKAQDRLLPNPISAPALAPAPVAPRPVVVTAPTPAVTGFPTPIGQRPVITAPPLMAAAPPVAAQPAQPRQTTRAPLRITVQRDPAFAGSSTGAMYQPGQVYNLGGNPLMAQANRTFTNTNTGQVLPGSSGLVRDMDISGRSRRSRDPLSPSQSLSGNW